MLHNERSLQNEKDIFSFDITHKGLDQEGEY